MPGWIWNRPCGCLPSPTPILRTARERTPPRRPAIPSTVGCRAADYCRDEHRMGVLPVMRNDAETAVDGAEHERFATVLPGLFLGVLGEYVPEPWYDAAVDLLSRGAAPKLWAS